jgi:hypothetical protein
MIYHTIRWEGLVLVAKWIRKSSVGLLSLGLLVSVSGCWSAPDAQTSAEYGALQGALIGSVFGCASAYNFSSRHNEATAFAVGCPIGLAAGAVIGGVAGYAMYGPAPKQWEPPAKKPPSTSSVSPNPAEVQSFGLNTDGAVPLFTPVEPSPEHHITDLSSL